MKEFTVGFDPARNRSEPNDAVLVNIKDRVATRYYHVTQNNIKSFSGLIGESGCAFCPATFKFAFEDICINMTNFTQIQLFVLEFKDGSIYEEVSDRAKRYDLPILFAHETFDGRLRAGFLNDVSIVHPKVAEIMLSALMTIFPEADLASKDLTTVYLGGRKLLHYDDSIPTVNIASLIENMCLYLHARYGEKNYRRKVYDFSNFTGLALTERKMFDISVIDDREIREEKSDEDSSPRSYLYIIENGDKSSRSNLSYRIGIKNENHNNHQEITNPSTPKKKKTKIHKPHRSSDLNDVRLFCQLFREFEGGDRRLNQDELSGVASNLIQVETGSSTFMEILRKRSYYTDDVKRYSDWNFRLNYMKKSGCQSIPCVRFCPHGNQCHHAGHITSTAKPKPRTTQVLANTGEQLYPLEEARADFKEKLDMALKADDKMIHAINAPIAIGKSTAILDLMEKNDYNILIACPSNDLKNELYEKAIARGIRAVRSPSLLESKDKLPTDVWSNIQRLYQTGMHHAVFNYVEEVISNGKVDSQCLELLKGYLSDLKKFHASDCHAFTTHSRLLTLTRAYNHWLLRKYGAVIIDEDILLNCMMPSQIDIPLPKLTDVLDQIDSKSGLAKKIKMAAEAAKSKSWFTLPYTKYDEAYEDISSGIDIPSFCRAEKFYFKKKADEKNLLESNHSEESIVFLKPVRLNPYTKYIMLSATVDQTICNYYFGSNRVQFYQCKKAANVGTLNQYPHNTMSRAYIDKNIGAIEAIRKATGFNDIITFKKYGIGNLYFGKTTGIDSLRGNKLNVIGTPHQPEWVYKLFAYAMGKEFDETATLSYQPVRHKGFQFHFMTFGKGNELLRNIQFWMIESEIVQAVGRARLLLDDCTVNLFSNFPIAQANLIPLSEHILPVTSDKIEDGYPL
ncbi:MAG: hypothetical protein FWG94_07070 [Oscillospiraceae bacterium]|nr:hypothetical protein [Oscillospiraceae bacterium]